MNGNAMEMKWNGMKRNETKLNEMTWNENENENERKKEWKNEWMNEWTNERTNEWMNERMSEWMPMTFCMICLSEWDSSWFSFIFFFLLPPPPLLATFAELLLS